MKQFLKKKFRELKEQLLKSIKKEDVIYLGIKINDEEIRKLCKKLGLTEEQMKAIKREIHMTTLYKPKASQIYGSDVLGKEVTLKIIAFGMLRDENGNIENIGLKVLDEEKLSENEIAHVTVAIFGKGKARNTGKCNFCVPLNEILHGQFAVFDANNNWAFEVTE